MCTPDFFGYNAAGELQYQDRIDSGDPRKSEPDARRKLLEAMKQIVETGKGPSEQIQNVSTLGAISQISWISAAYGVAAWHIGSSTHQAGQQ